MVTATELLLGGLMLVPNLVFHVLIHFLASVTKPGHQLSAALLTYALISEADASLLPEAFSTQSDY